MQLTSPNFADGERIPGENAFAVPDPDQHIVFSENRNPAFSWDDVPENTRSFALLCIDPDVPSIGDDVNVEGKTIPADLPRVDFVHWVLIDIPADVRTIEEGAFSKGGVVPGGKEGRHDSPREGVNDYTDFFAGDTELEGTYRGYDGPCPPWNDLLPHRYVFTLYALDVEALPVSGNFTARDVLEAMEGHILAEASLTGTYSLNPAAQSSTRQD